MNVQAVPMNDDMTDAPRYPDPEANDEPGSLGAAFASSSPRLPSAERRASMIAQAVSAFDPQLRFHPEDELSIRRSRRPRWQYVASAAAVVAVALPIGASFLAGRADISTTQDSASAISSAERAVSPSTALPAAESATAGAPSEQQRSGLGTPPVPTVASSRSGPSSGADSTDNATAAMAPSGTVVSPTVVDLGSFVGRAALETTLSTSGLATSFQSVGQSFPASCAGFPIVAVSNVVAQAVVGDRSVVIIRLAADGRLEVLDAAACSVLGNDR